MFGDIFDDLVASFGKEAVTLGLPILGAITLAAAKLFAAKYQQLRDFLESRSRALSAVKRTQTADGPREGHGVWTFQPIIKPENYDAAIQRSKILSIVNLKGGVGKTTIAANVGAYLASDSAWKKRVLLIDLDYQGSLSSMAFSNDTSWIPTKGIDSIATQALSGEILPNSFVTSCKEVRQQARLKVATAYYDLAQADNRLLIEWLLNSPAPDLRSWRKWLSDFFAGKLYQPNEMRYNLARLLHSDAVHNAFDLIIIDCPPRLTAGTIQALCASSHILVPTILDKPSAESVMSFCEQLDLMKSSGLCPHIKHIGVVATRFGQTLTVTATILRQLEDAFKRSSFDCGLIPQINFVPDSTKLVRSLEEGIAYFSLRGDRTKPDVIGAFAELSRYVANQVGVSPLRPFEKNEPDDDGQLSFPVAAE